MTLFYRRPKFTKPPLDEPFTINYGSPQARSLVAWWPPIASRGAGVLRDVAGGLTASFNGDMATVPDSKLGYVCQLDGTNDYINAGNSAKLTLNMSRSISTWIRLTAISEEDIVARWVEGTAVREYLLMAYVDTTPVANALRGHVKLSSGTIVSVDGDTAIALNVWHCVAQTWDSTTLTIYLDGRPCGSKAASGNPIADTGTATTFGNRLVTGGGPYNVGWLNGKMADTRIHSVALDPSTIWQMYDPATRWDLYAPLLRFWAIGEIAGGAVRISPSLAHIGLSNVPRVSPRAGV